MYSQIKIRRDARENYNLANPILALGEMGFVVNEFPTPVRIGDGTTEWSSLQEQYFTLLTGEQVEALYKFFINSIARLKDSDLLNLNDSEDTALYSRIDPALDSEVAQRIAEDKAIRLLIEQVKKTLQSSDSALSKEIVSLTVLINSVNDSLNSAISNESEERKSAINALDERISINSAALEATAQALVEEAILREDADNALSDRIKNVSSAIEAESRLRQQGDILLEEALSEESLNRRTKETQLDATDASLQQQIDNISQGAGWRYLVDSTGAALYDLAGVRLCAIYSPAVAAEAHIRELEDQRVRTYAEYLVQTRMTPYDTALRQISENQEQLNRDFVAISTQFSVIKSQVEYHEEAIDNLFNAIDALNTGLVNEATIRKEADELHASLISTLQSEVKALQERASSTDTHLVQVDASLDTLSNKLSSETQNRESQVNAILEHQAIQDDLIESASKSIADEATARARSDEEQRGLIRENELAIELEKQVRAEADATIQGRVDTLQSDVDVLKDNLGYLILPLQDSAGKVLLDSTGATLYCYNTPAVDAEVNLRTTEFNLIRSDLDSLKDLRKLPLRIDAEANERRTADQELAHSINSVEESLENKLLNEETARQDADASLSARIDAIDLTPLSNAIEKEAEIRAQNDLALQKSIESLSSTTSEQFGDVFEAQAAEETARATADQALNESQLALNDRVTFIEPMVFTTALDSTYEILHDSEGRALILPVATAVDVEATIRQLQDNILLNRILSLEARLEKLEQII